MVDRIQFLPPEPITLLDGEVDNSGEENENNENEGDSSTNSLFTNINNTSTGPATGNVINNSINFSRVQVSDCIIISGDDNTKFAVWKITVRLEQSSKITKSRKPVVSRQIHVYRRYSAFVQFRDELIRIIRLKRPNSEIPVPPLPPGVPWYDIWQYQEVNLEKGWLNKRRKGLEFFMNSVLLNKTIVDLCQGTIRTFLQRRLT